VSCEPDVVQLLNTGAFNINGGTSGRRGGGGETTSTAMINNRPVTIKTFKLEPGMTLHDLSLPPGSRLELEQASLAAATHKVTDGHKDAGR
jgi:hypothetical protein